MGKLVEPYAKDKNVLQLPLFDFGRRKQNKTHITWEDSEGEYSLTCSCTHGVPGSFEQDVYTACTRIWVRLGMPNEFITVTYTSIAKELGVNARQWNTHIKRSLEKLAQARYELNQCFVAVDEEGTKNIDAHFSLFDSVVLFSVGKDKNFRKSKSNLAFPEIIKNNLSKEYYQYLDMVWYRALPNGLPRRLYEYLAKRKYHGVKDKFVISEVAICRWLPITDKHATNRRKTLTKTATALIEAGYLKKYEFLKNKKQCVYYYSNQKLPNGYTKNITENENEVIVVENKSTALDPKAEDNTHKIEIINSKNKLDITPLLELIKLKRTPLALRAKIEKYAKSHGFDYVRKNILYSNKKANRSYSAYLSKALANNYGDLWHEEQEQKQEIQQQTIEDYVNQDRSQENKGAAKTRFRES